jgi:hypothetical protein
MDDGYTYTTKQLTNTASFSVESLRKSFREMEWISYEVDPEWSRFCSFGPDDIGSVWEKIGAIRKRPRYDAIMIGDKMLKALNQRIESDFFSGPQNYLSGVHDARLFGLRVIGTPHLTDTAILIKGCDV